MVELTAAVPDRVAEDVIDTIAWVRQHLDHGFEVNSAVTEALLAWVADVRLEFINVDFDEDQAEANPVPAVAGIGGRS